MALIPRGRQILGAYGGFVKGLDVDASIQVSESYGGIETVDGLMIRDPSLRKAGCPVGSQLPQIHVE